MDQFTHHRELKPYLNPTPAMRLGAPGKSGKLHLIFELDKQKKSVMRHWKRQAPLIVQQELYFDESMPEMPCVYILSSGGPNVDGDRYENYFIVRKDAYAFISTGAATKIAEMIYNFSGVTQTFELEENAYLEYIPEAIIPCRNSRYLCETSITIHPTATLFFSEIYTGGRKYYKEGELFVFDLLSICTQAYHPNKTPLFREKMVISPKEKSIRNIGILSHYDTFANVIVLTPPEKATAIYLQTEVFIQHEPDFAVGISYLPNHCGLIFKVLGNDTQSIKKKVREFASTVRLQIKGKPLPEEFIWK